MIKRLGFLFLFLLVSCASEPTLLLSEKEDFSVKKLAKLLAEHPLLPEENIKAVLLEKTEQVSYHLIQIRDREKPHIHKTHDLTVFLLKGRGEMHLGANSFPIKKGDVIRVPAGARHFYVNKGKSPSVAYVIFTPPYHGKDRIFSD